MANTLQIKRSTTAATTPTLDVGELGVNLTDRKLWVGGNGAGNIALGGDGLFLKADGLPDAHTKLLIHSDTHDGSTTFTDASGSGHTFSKYGNLQHKIAQKVFGSSSMYFDGSGDYLTAPYSSDHDFGSGDFTVDAWVRMNNGWTHAVIVGQDADNTGVRGWHFRVGTNATLLFRYSTTGSNEVDKTSSATGIVYGQWYHVAFVRSGNTYAFYVNGVQKGTGSITETLYSSGTNTLRVGMRNSDLYFNGYMDELRVSNGIARWTANFTPPTRPYSYVDLNSNLNVAGYLEAPNIDGKPDKYTKLLIHSDTTDGRGTFTDSSPSGHALTTNGTPTHETEQSKFGASSLYFGGDDGLHLPVNSDWDFGTGDFTIDYWVRYSSFSVYQTIWDYGYVQGLLLQTVSASSGALRAYVGGGSSTYYVSESTTPALNTWYHYAVVRSSGIVTIYRDGVNVGSATRAASIAGSFSTYDNTPAIGVSSSHATAHPNFYLNGYIDEFRVSKGIARWTAAFTPPTRPYATFSAGDGLFTGELVAPRIAGDTTLLGALTVAGQLKANEEKWGTWTEAMLTTNGGSQTCRILEDWTGRWILIGRFAADAKISIKGVIPTVRGLSTATGQSTATQFSADWGDSYPTEVRILGATDFADFQNTKTVDWVWGVPTGRPLKHFFTDGNSSGMNDIGKLVDYGEGSQAGGGDRFGFECRGAYDGKGRWTNPKYAWHKMSDGNVTVLAAAFTAPDTDGISLNGSSDAKFTVSHILTRSGQDDYVTAGFGIDDTTDAFFDAYGTSGAGDSGWTNMGGGDVYSSAVWVLIKIPQDTSDWRLRPSSGDILLGGTENRITGHTPDGLDKQRLRLSGGGNPGGTDRGATVTLSGNEYSSNAGVLYLQSGNVGTADIRFNTGGSDRLKLSNTGDLYPAADDSYNLGTTSYRWKNGYFGNVDTATATLSNHLAGTTATFNIGTGADGSGIKLYTTATNNDPDITWGRVNGTVDADKYHMRVKGAAGGSYLALYNTAAGSDTGINLKGGNIGIGDTTPTYKLDVNGTFRNVGDHTVTTGQIRLTDQYGLYWVDSTVRILGSKGANYLRFYTNSTQRFDITGAAATFTVPLTGTSATFDGDGTFKRFANYRNLTLQRAQGTSASPTTVGNGQTLGKLSFSGYTGSVYREGASIAGKVTAGVSGDEIPSSLLFYTAADGATSPTVRLTIDHTGAATFGGALLAPSGSTNILNKHTKDLFIFSVGPGNAGLGGSAKNVADEENRTTTSGWTSYGVQVQAVSKVAWLKVDCLTTYRVTSFAISTYPGGRHKPGGNWELQGSNDDSSWTTLGVGLYRQTKPFPGTGTDYSGTYPFDQQQIVRCTTVGDYRYFRFYSDTYSDNTTNGYLLVMNWGLFVGGTQQDSYNRPIETAFGMTVGGSITPIANDSYHLGNDSNRFKNLYLAGDCIVSGNSTVGGNLDVTGGLVVDGASTLGDSNDTTHVKGSLIVDTNIYGPSLGVVQVAAGLNVTGNASITGDLAVSGTINQTGQTSRLFNHPVPGLQTMSATLNASTVSYIDSGYNLIAGTWRGVVWTGQHYIFTDANNDKIYFYDSFFQQVKNEDGVYFEQLPHNPQNPHGAAWDGRYLWVAEYGSGTTAYLNAYDVYHGDVTRIAHCAYDGGGSGPNVYGVGYAQGLLYTIYNGVTRGWRWDGGDTLTQVVTNSAINTAGYTSFGAQGITYDGSHLWVTQNGTNIFKLSLDGSIALNIGYTAGQTPPNITGWTWNGENIVCFDYAQYDIYIINTAQRVFLTEAVGIGTTSPTAKLETRGADQTKQLVISNSTYESGTYDNETGIWFKGNFSTSDERAKAAIILKGTADYGVGDLVFAIDGGASNDNAVLADEKMRITSAGNVGIGTTAPDAKLHLNGTGVANAPTLAIDNTTAGTYIHSVESFSPNMTSGQTNIIVVGRAGSAKNSGYIGYKYSSAGSNANVLTLGHWSGNHLVNIKGDGNVGIGTTAPDQLLHVNTSATAGGTDNFALRLQNPNTVADARVGIAFATNAQTGTSWDGAAIQGANNGVDGKAHILFGEVGNNTFTENVRFTTDGRVGIGTTAPGAYKLYVNGTGYFGSTINAVGAITSGAGITGTTGSFSGALTGTTATFSGVVTGAVIDGKVRGVPSSANGTKFLEIEHSMAADPTYYKLLLPAEYNTSSNGGYVKLTVIWHATHASSTHTQVAEFTYGTDHSQGANGWLVVSPVAYTNVSDTTSSYSGYVITPTLKLHRGIAEDGNGDCGVIIQVGGKSSYNTHRTIRAEITGRNTAASNTLAYFGTSNEAGAVALTARTNIGGQDHGADGMYVGIGTGSKNQWGVNNQPDMPLTVVTAEADKGINLKNSAGVELITMRQDAGDAAAIFLRDGGTVMTKLTSRSDENSYFAASGLGVGTAGSLGTNKLLVVGDATVSHGNIIGVTNTSTVGLKVLSSDGGGLIYGFDMNHAISFRYGRDGVVNTTNYYQYGGTLANNTGHRFYTGGSIQSQTLRLQIANDGATFSGALTATSVTATDIAGGTGTFGTHAKIGSVAATARYYADGTNNISMTPTGGATYFSNQGASVTYGYFNATGLTVTGTGSFSGALTGTSATFSGNVGGVGLTLSDGWLELYNANVLQLYSTPTTAGANYETFALDKPDAGNARLRVYKSGTGTYRGMEFQTGGSARLTISAAGAATFSGALTSTGDFTTEGYVQHTSYLYSRNNLAVLNAAGTGWNTWATRSNGQFNLNVGTITSGALTATSVNVSGAIKKAGASWGTWTETLYTANGGSKSCRIVEDWTGRWIVVGRFAANAMTSIQGNIPTVSGLSTSTGQSTATQFSCDWGDSKPTEVRIMGATDFANYYTSRTVDWIWGVPTGRAWKYFFTDGNASGMTHGGASGSLTPGGNTNRWGWECRGAYDGRGRWSNPGYRFHKMSDGNPTITAAAFTSANGSAMNLETASDAKFTVHSNRVHSGQDGYMTSGFGNDDNIQGFFDAYESNTSGHVSNMNDGTDEYSSAVWVMIKLDGLASNMLKVEAECPDNFAATIKNTSTDDGSGLRIDTTATTNTDLYALGIYTNSNTGVFIENDGKLAIGSTTAGAYELYVNGTGFFKENLELDSTLSVGGALTATSGTFSSTLSAGTTSVVSSGPLTVFRTGAGDVGMIATFRGSGGLRQLQIANYLCGSDTDRAGLYWENQNVGNIRMWMGEDLVLRQKTSTPTSATDGDRYVKESSGNISTGAGTFSGAVTSDSVGTFVSSCGIRHAGGNGHLGRFYETGSDGFLELSTGHNPTVVRTKISSYGVSYFTPTGTNAGVGIGTTAPGAYKLYVNGNTWVQGSLETSGQLKAGTSVAIGSAGSGGYTLPAADGTNGYVLKTNGSGTVAWAADSSGGGSGDITSVIGGNAIDVSGGSSGDATVNHANTSSQSSVYCANYTVIEDVVLDAYGHVTGLATKLVGDTTGFALVSYGTCGVKLTWTEAGSAETDIAYPASCGGGGGS